MNSTTPLIDRHNLLVLPLIALCMVIGCSRTESEATDPDAPFVERGRLKFAASLHSLRIGDKYAYRDVTQTFLVNGKEWAPSDDPDVANRINWCDTSPNPEVEILRCPAGPLENYSTTYILKMVNDQPRIDKIEDGTGNMWIDAEGRWLLGRHFYYNVDTGERIPVRGMPFADDPDGSAPIQYVLGVSPDKKTVIGSYDLMPDTGDKDQLVKLWVIDTVSGQAIVRHASLAKYPWLRDDTEPSDDIVPPPSPSTRFVWQRNAAGRDVLTVPVLLDVVKVNRPAASPIASPLAK